MIYTNNKYKKNNQNIKKMEKKEKTQEMLVFFAEIGHRGLSDSRMMRKSRLLMEEYRVLYEQAQFSRNTDYEVARALARRSPEVFEYRKQISQMIGVFLGMLMIPVGLIEFGFGFMEVFDTWWICGCYAVLLAGLLIVVLRMISRGLVLEREVASVRLYELELGAVYFYQDSELFVYVHEKILNYLARIEGMKSDFYLFLEKEDLPEKRPCILSHPAYQRRLKKIQKQILLSFPTSERKEISPKFVRYEAKNQLKQEQKEFKRYAQYWHDRVYQKIRSLSGEYDIPVKVIYDIFDF